MLSRVQSATFTDPAAVNSLDGSVVTSTGDFLGRGHLRTVVAQHPGSNNWSWVLPRPFDTQLAYFIAAFKLLSCLGGHWSQAFSLCALEAVETEGLAQAAVAEGLHVLRRSSTWGATSSRMRFIVALAFLATCQTAFGCGMVRCAGQHLYVRQTEAHALSGTLQHTRTGPAETRAMTAGASLLALTLESAVFVQLAASVKHIDAFIGTIVTIENDLLAPLAPFGRKLRQVRPSFVCIPARIPWQQPFPLIGCMQGVHACMQIPRLALCVHQT